MFLARLPDIAAARHQGMLDAAAHARRVHEARLGRPHPPRLRLPYAPVTGMRLHAGHAGTGAST